MVEHTPGPWHLCQHLKSMECDQACKCGYRGVIFGPEHNVAMAICQPGHELPRHEEQWGSEPARYPREVELANAHLIAAAPDLLEALVKARNTLAGCGMAHIAADICDAAIARATGEQP